MAFFAKCCIACTSAQAFGLSSPLPVAIDSFGFLRFAAYFAPRLSGGIDSRAVINDDRVFGPRDPKTKKNLSFFHYFDYF